MCWGVLLTHDAPQQNALQKQQQRHLKYSTFYGATWTTFFLCKASTYLTMVCPIMEYASSVWDKTDNNQAIEKFQCRAPRRLEDIVVFLTWWNPWTGLHLNLGEGTVGFKLFTRESTSYQYHPTCYPHNICIIQTILCIWVHIPVIISNPLFPQQSSKETIYHFQWLDQKILISWLLDL